MKIIKKVLFATIIFALLVMKTSPNICFASETNAFSLEDVIGYGNDFLQQGNTSTVVTPSPESLKLLSNSVSGILLSIAIVVTLISVVIMGINFIIQSVEEKAKIKESMVPWIIGIIISFGAYGIWKLTMSVFYQL